MQAPRCLACWRNSKEASGACGGGGGGEWEAVGDALREKMGQITWGLLGYCKDFIHLRAVRRHWRVWS